MTGTMQIQQQLAAAILRVPERVLHVFVLKRVFNCCGPLSGLQECCGGAGFKQKSAGSFAGAKQEQSEGAREFFFARVPPTVTSDELLAVFSKYGVVENLNLFK
jgi:hypothetical protein